MVLLGHEIPRDIGTVYDWLETAAGNGNTDCQIILGSLYYAGNVDGEGKVSAYMWWNIAKILGNKYAIKIMDGMDENAGAIIHHRSGQIVWLLAGVKIRQW
jgi:TPR repeat protein